MKTENNIVIIARHQGVVDWLKGRGIEGTVIPHADYADVCGRDVIGVLPLHLAAAANTITTIDMDDLPLEMRGKELTPAEMDRYGACLHTYKVTKVK